MSYIRQLTHSSHLTQHDYFLIFKNGFFQKMNSWILKFSSKKSLRPLIFFRKKVFARLIFFEKSLRPPIFFEKKVCAPLFFSKKKSSPPCRWSRPGYPINFDPSLKIESGAEKSLNNLRMLWNMLLTCVLTFFY